jgi:hypothetical protein
MADTNHDATFDDVLKLVRKLSPVQKLRLIKRVAPEIERELVAARPGESESLLGLVQDLGPAPSADQIDACREEAWSNFPREEA